MPSLRGVLFLAPSDFFVFPNLKKKRVRRFEDEMSLQAAIVH